MFPCASSLAFYRFCGLLNQKGAEGKGKLFCVGRRERFRRNVQSLTSQREYRIHSSHIDSLIRLPCPNQRSDNVPISSVGRTMVSLLNTIKFKKFPFSARKKVSLRPPHCRTTVIQPQGLYSKPGPKISYGIMLFLKKWKL